MPGPGTRFSARVLLSRLPIVPSTSTARYCSALLGYRSARVLAIRVPLSESPAIARPEFSPARGESSAALGGCCRRATSRYGSEYSVRVLAARPFRRRAADTAGACVASSWLLTYKGSGKKE